MRVKKGAYEEMRMMCSKINKDATTEERKGKRKRKRKRLGTTEKETNKWIENELEFHLWESQHFATHSLIIWWFNVQEVFFRKRLRNKVLISFVRDEIRDTQGRRKLWNLCANECTTSSKQWQTAEQLGNCGGRVGPVTRIPPPTINYSSAISGTTGVVKKRKESKRENVEKTIVRWKERKFAEQ